MKKCEYILENLDCANCANKIQDKLSKKEGLKDVNVNFSKLKLTYYTENVSKEEVEKIILSLEPEVVMKEIADYNTKKEESANSKIKLEILRLIVGIILAVIGLLLNIPEILKEVFIISAYLTLLYRTIKNACTLLVRSKSIDESFLITVSCIGAYLVGERFEGLMVIILYEIGKILEDKAVNKTRKSIADLMNIKPEYANIKNGENINKVSPEEVKVGDIIIVKQGEKIPLDGVIIKGKTSLNTASLTGESKLTKVKETDNVLSGSINTDGIIEIKVTERYENSTVSRILELVENASDKKAKTETFVNRAAKIYTPIVIILAILVAVFLPILSKEVTYSQSVYRALIFLVISCPCAIAISVPLSYFSGIGKSSKEGILIKGSDYLDSLKNVKEIVFDKTGTLTKGEFGIQEIKVLNEKYTIEKLKEFLVLGESFSNHPIAKSILKEIDIEVNKDEVENYKEISGKGISYELKGDKILIGNEELTGYEEKSEESLSKIFIKVNQEIIGYVVLSDKIKPGTKEMIEKLKAMQIKTKMFTGDKLEVAKEVGKIVGITDIKAEMLPENKYNEMEKIVKEKSNKDCKVAFVGDGINDSPVLAISDIGISMGGVGSESAIEASDVVIMTDNLEKIVDAIKISKKTGDIIKQNLIFAIGIKALILLLSVLGIANMWEAVFADVGVTLITIFNTLRILK